MPVPPLVVSEPIFRFLSLKQLPPFVTGGQQATTSQYGMVIYATPGQSLGLYAVQANDPRLSNTRDPNQHNTTHMAGGPDAIKLDDLATPDDNTDLNATTGRHGLMSKADKVKLDGIPPGGGATPDWGDIGGTLSDQTDLQAALDLKAPLTTKLDDWAAPDDNTDLDATTSAHGLMSKLDKVKLDGIPPGGGGSGTPAWGAIVGTLSDQTDLQAALNLKAPLTTKLDDWATPDDNTDLNATSGHHGLLPKLSGNSAHVFKGDGTFGTLSVGGVVNTVVAGTGITVDSTDPVNPIVALSAGTLASLNGAVQSVVAGTNVTIDNTDPLNPIISATGGGGGGTGDVVGPASSPNAGDIPTYADSTGKLLTVGLRPSTGGYGATDDTKLAQFTSIGSLRGRHFDAEMGTPVKGTYASDFVRWDDGTYSTWLNFQARTATRTIVVPNKDGTIAMLSDIPPAGGTGDVVGPASSTADSLARFDGATGKLLKDGLATSTGGYLADTGKVPTYSVSGTLFAIQHTARHPLFTTKEAVFTWSGIVFSNAAYTVGILPPASQIVGGFQYLQDKGGTIATVEDTDTKAKANAHLTDGDFVFVGDLNPPVATTPTSNLAGNIYIHTPATTTTQSTFAAVLVPFDTTIPQNTEGTEVLTVTVTPKHASSTLIIEFKASGAVSVAALLSVALYQDSTADAIAVSFEHSPAANYTIPFHHRSYHPAGSTTARTYKIRLGSNVANTFYFLRNSSVPVTYGGSVVQATFTVTEMMP